MKFILKIIIEPKFYIVLSNNKVMDYVRKAFNYAFDGSVDGYKDKRIVVDSILSHQPIPESGTQDIYFYAIGNSAYNFRHPIKFVKAGVVSGREFFILLKQYLERRKK